jgi:hypothetical protein
LEIQGCGAQHGYVFEPRLLGLQPWSCLNGWYSAIVKTVYYCEVRRKCREGQAWIYEPGLKKICGQADLHASAMG